MNIALRAISTGTTATPSDQEAISRFGMVSTIHEVNQWGQQQQTTKKQLTDLAWYQRYTRLTNGDSSNKQPRSSKPIWHDVSMGT